MNNQDEADSENRDLYMIPNLFYKTLAKECLNSSKTSHINGNDKLCQENCQKLFQECEKLADDSILKTRALNDRRKEFELLQEKAKQSQNLDSQFYLQEAKSQLKNQEAQIQYLDAQLKKKEEENKQLRIEKEEYIRNKLLGKDGQQNKDLIDWHSNLEFEKQFYKKFNQDIKSRLKFVERIMDWKTFESQVQGNFDSRKSEIFEEVHEDEKITAAHHFSLRKNGVARSIESVYFPVIDVQEHDALYRQEDFLIKTEFDKIIDVVLIELIALQDVIKKLGQQSDKGSRQMNEQQSMVLSGLLKRLLNQLPVKISGQYHRTNDFEAKISNLYMLLQQRVFMKKVFEVTLDVNMMNAQTNIDTCTEQIITVILDYEQFCMDEEEKAMRAHQTPQKIMEIFQKKIKDKMKNYVAGRFSEVIKSNQKGLIQDS